MVVLSFALGPDVFWNLITNYLDLALFNLRVFNPC